MNKYIQPWLPQDSRLEPFYKGMSDFIAENLKANNSIDIENLKPKIISDPILGYIHLTNIEVAIIDTPLFQRLRGISQLGLANLVFPSLNYTRFEHSLGVLGHLNQVLNKIIENNHRFSDDDSVNKIIEKYETSIRIAALLHDSGHTLYSHCSERVINKLKGVANYPSSEFIREIFTQHFKKKKFIPFAEIFTLVIIGSNNLLDFLAKTEIFTKRKLKEILKWSGRFILGLPDLEDAKSVFLAQLMSSGLDVDKIDYMTREQHYSGIRLEIDLERILSKLQVFDLKSHELPKQLSYLNELYSDDTNFKILGFSKGGQFAFEEFCIARLALHVKIYLHQKVRAAEGQLEKYLRGLTKIDFYKKVHNWLRLPEAIVYFPELINSVINEQPNLFTVNRVDRADMLGFKNIVERNIFLRAYAFGPLNNFSEGFEDINIDKLSGKSINDFFSHFKNSNFLEKIINEANKIIELINEINIYNLKDNIIIDFPRLINIQQGQESIYFEKSPLIPIRWTIPIDKIVIYFQENRALTYVFSSNNIAHIITLASEKVLYEETKKVFNQEGFISNSIFDDSLKLKRKLTEKGYYKKTPQLKGISSYLKSAEAATQIKNIYESLAGFKSLNDERITINRITTFVNQFPINLQKVCLAFLNHLKVYNESLLKDELEKVLNKIEKDKKIGIAYLGGATDSGGRLTYNLRDTFEKFNIKEPSKINDSLIEKSDCLIIYDDNINSGLQLINIFGELLDDKNKIDSNSILNEKHLEPLANEENKRKLKNMDIYFVYILGFEGIQSKIKNQLNKFFGFKKENIIFSINTLFNSNDKIFSGNNSDFNHEHKKELKEYLESVGEKLLKNEGKSEQKINTCKLGYAQAEAMVLFPYNVPTMTITALWCKGEVDDGIPWFPLAERRRRTKNGKYIGEDL